MKKKKLARGGGETKLAAEKINENKKNSEREREEKTSESKLECMYNNVRVYSYGSISLGTFLLLLRLISLRLSMPLLM